MSRLEGRSYRPEPTAEDVACLAHLEAYFAGEADLDLDRLARHIAEGGDERGEIEDRLTEAYDVAIFAAGAPRTRLPAHVLKLHGLDAFTPAPVPARLE